MFFVLNKDKIISYIVTIATICVLLVIATITTNNTNTIETGAKTEENIIIENTLNCNNILN